MCETVCDPENNDADTVRDNGDEVGDPANANTKRKVGDHDDTNAENTDVDGMKYGDDKDMGVANYDNADGSDVDINKANDDGSDNVDAANADKSNDGSNANDDADNDNAYTGSKAKYCVSNDNDIESNTNNLKHGDPYDTDNQHDPDFLSIVVQRCLPQLTLVH